MERLPATIVQMRGIDHHTVGVHLRILLAGGVVVKLGDDQVAGANGLPSLWRSHPRLGIAVLNDGQSARHRCAMGLLDRFIAAD